MSIVYREVTYEDWNEMAHFFSESWFFKGLIEDQILDKYSRYFLLNAYQHASFCYIALKEDQIVGFLMGNCCKLFVENKQIIEEVQQLSQELEHHPQCKLMKETIKNYYIRSDEMIKESNMNIKDELLLFCVDGNCRGQGIGKTLLNMAYSYFISNDVHQYHLITDSICHYQLYDHLGLTQYASTDFIFNLPNESRDIKIFVYTHKI